MRFIIFRKIIISEKNFASNNFVSEGMQTLPQNLLQNPKGSTESWGRGGALACLFGTGFLFSQGLRLAMHGVALQIV